MLHTGLCGAIVQSSNKTRYDKEKIQFQKMKKGIVTAI